MHVIHIGKNADKLTRAGWKEVSALHVGKGIWIFRLEKRKFNKKDTKCINRAL